MSQISVVHYNNAPFNKVNVLQQNNVNNKQNDRQVIVLRKPPHILPQPKDLDKDDVLLTNNGKKKQKAKELKTNPQPVAVARRNARERNRVKQVNNGFATLRQHIPNFIAAAFEGTNGRGGNKKLSKVETLRMAVEYIRSLEDILAMDNDSNDVVENISNLSYPSPSSSLSPNQQNPTQTGLSYSYQVLSPPEDDDDLSSTATPPPQQFIRINASSSYQIIPSNLYENGENLDPMIIDDNLLSDPSLIDANLGFTVNNQDLYLHNLQTTSSLSPGILSDNSLSPHPADNNDHNASCFIPVFDTPPQDRLSPTISVQIKTEESELPVISLKTENELPDQHKDSIVDVLQWWEEQPQNTGS